MHFNLHENLTYRTPILHSKKTLNWKGMVMSGTLFEKLGGEDAVNAAVEIFYRKVLNDSSISDFFDNTDMDEQIAKQKSFLTMVFGGPNNYTGKELREAHAPLVARGLNDSHFNTVAGHLQATLEELGVSEDLITQALAIAGTTHDDVLGL